MQIRMNGRVPTGKRTEKERVERSFSGIFPPDFIAHNFYFHPTYLAVKFLQLFRLKGIPFDGWILVALQLSNN